MATSVRKDQRLLFVDDDPSLILIKDYFECEGYPDVITANSAREALKILEPRLPDLIVSEVILPEMDGYEFLKEIRQNERTSSIPFIFLSVKREIQDIIKGLNLGAKVFMSKPYEPEILLAQIKALLPEPPLVTFEVLLNETELKVLQSVVKDLANRDIAKQLHIPKSAVETHVKKMLVKTCLPSPTELISWAKENQIV